MSSVPDYHLTIKDQAKSAEERIQACFQLLVENSEKSIKLLQQGLQDDPSPIVRHECAYSLGELTYDDGYQGLIQAIENDTNPFVVHEAALALANLGVEEAREPLEKLLEHPIEDVVLTAKISLQRLEMKLEDVNLQHFHLNPREIILDLNSKEEHRIQASFLLMEDGSEDALDTLITALHQEPDPIVKHEIIFSLGETASSRVVHHLVEEMLTDPNPFVKHEAALALGTLGRSEIADDIRQLLDDNNPDIVESAKIALERLLT